MRFRHVTSVDILIKVINSRTFCAVSNDPHHADSGINGYVQGDPFTRAQDIRFRGAELIFEWDGNIIYDPDVILPLPYPPNTLVKQGAWRSVITANTIAKNIKLIDFEVDEYQRLHVLQRVKLLLLRKKLIKKPIHISLGI